MAKPDKPAPKPPIIDVNDSDQVIRLALAAMFSITWMARGKTIDDYDRCANSFADYADALMRAASKLRP